MLLLEHGQYLQSCGAESSRQTEISSFKFLAKYLPTKTARMGLQRGASWVRSVMNPYIYINPAPGDTQQRRRGHVVRLYRRGRVYSGEL